MTSPAYSVLYVDDEPGLLEIAKIYLEQTGDFHIEISPSVKAALDANRIASYDAIVSDYQMPGMDGIAFLKLIRERFGDIPFVLFTGRGREEVVIEAINNGADFYLQKGGDPEAQFVELAHKIRRAINRKRAELSIIESEKRLADIINFLPDATFAIDRAGHVIAWNRAIEEMTGVSAADMLGKGDYEYAIPFYSTPRKILIDLIFEPVDSISQNYAHVTQVKGILTADTTLPRPRGKVVTLMVTASPLYDRKGKIVGAIESIRDITDRKNAEVALFNAQKDWESIFRAIGHPAMILDPERRIIEVNDATIRDTGRSRDELLGLNCYEVFHCKDATGPPPCCPFEMLRKTGSVQTAEMEVQTLNGYYSVSCTPVYDPDGNLEKIIHISMDITGRRKAEEELREAHEQLTASEEELRSQYEELVSRERRIRESELRFRELAELLPQGIYEAAPDGRILFVNRMALELFGYTAADIEAGLSAMSVIAPVDRVRGAAAFHRRAVEGTPPQNNEYLALRKDGSTFPVSIFASPIHRDGRITGIRGVIIDISEQKKAADEILTANEQLTASAEELQVQYDELARQEQQIRESEEKYRQVVQFSPFGMHFYVINPDGALIFIGANPAADAILGVDHNQFIGKDILTAFPGLAVTEVPDRYRDVAQRGGSWQTDQITYAEGKIRGAYKVVAFQMRPGAMVAVFFDITDRKRAEEALRESEENYRAIIENIQDIIYRSDLDGNLTMVSPSFAAKLGYGSVDECIGKNVVEYFWMYPERRQEFLDELERNGSVSDYELVLKKKDGTPLIISTSSHFHHARDGAVDGVEGIFHDITVEKEAQQQIRILAGLNDISPASVIVHNPDGTMLYANERTFGLHGYTRDEFMALNLRQIDVPASEELMNERIEKLRRTGEATFDVEHFRKDGSILPLRVNTKFTRWNDREVIMSVSTDISDLKRVENALRERESALRIANNKLNLLSSMTRHDIINKIAVLRGNLKLTEKNCHDPRMLGFMKKMDASIAAIQSQIEFTRVYQDLGTHEPQWIDLASVVSRLAIPETIALKVDVEGVSVFADMMLENVFSNLLDNAVRHGEHATEIQISSHAAGENLVIIWEDNGIGIPASEKERIFERWFGKNNGLGLFLAREVLSLTGITITERGKAGNGARFEIVVPQGAWRIPAEPS